MTLHAASNKQQISELSFSTMVYDCLKKICTTEESEAIQIEKIAIHRRIDLLIEKGIKKLDWPKNTIIELKTYLDPRTLRAAFDFYDNLQSSDYGVNKFIILYYNSIFSFVPKIDNNNGDILILSFEDLCKRCKNDINAEEDITQVPEKEYKQNTESKTWEKEREKKIEDLKRYITENQSTLFLGAGVSASANMPGWGKLLEQLLTQHSKDTSPNYFPCDLANVLHYCGESYLIAARYINFIIDLETRAKIIQKTLYQNPKQSELIDNICQLIKSKKVSQIITTNYDQLVEQSLKKEGLSPYPVSQSGIIPKNTIPIYHVHGSVNDPNNPIANLPEAPVLSEEDYHNLYSTGHHWSNTAILHALQHTHCIFIGLSMTDPNLRRLIETAFYNDTPHYVFLPRIPLYEGYYESDKRNVFHFRVQEDIMQSLGINVIWYTIKSNSPNPHEELTELIKELYQE